MKLNKILVYMVLGLCGLMALCFLADLAAGMPFGRAYIMTDIMVLIACGLIIYQAIETMGEFKAKK